MSYCIKCGHLAKENERFCTVCGTPLIASKNKDLARTVTVTKRKKVSSIPEENITFSESDWNERPDFPVNEEEIPSWNENEQENDSESLFTSVIENFKEEEETPNKPEMQYTPWDGSDSAKEQEWLDNEFESSTAMSVGKYLTSIIWMLIPVLGLILSIVWASGGTRFEERSKLAKAFLLLIAIAACICTVIYLIKWYF